MLAIADEPAIRSRLHPMSVETYHLLGKLGGLGQRTELLRGVVIDQMPKSPLHSSIIRVLDKHLLRVLPLGYHPRAEQPLTFPDSEPEPDLAVVAGTEADYFHAHPVSAEMVVEVCVSSEDLDRLKLAIYAAAGVKECWLVLAEARTVERHSDLRDGFYRKMDSITWPEALPSTVFSEITLPFERMFGA